MSLGSFSAPERSALPLATNGTQERLVRDLERGSKPLLKDKKRLVMLVKKLLQNKNLFLFRENNKNEKDSFYNIR